MRGLSYGWVLVLTLGVTETVSWGVLYYAFTVFVRPMEAELGWSRSATSGAFSLAVLLSGVAAVPVGRWLDRHGPRALMTAGSVAGTLLVLAWAAVGNLVALYAVWAGIGLTMAAVLYDPAFAVVAVWFRRRRALALTVLTLMAGLASTIFVPLAAWLVEAQGWRGALVTLAAILGVTTVLPHALLLRRAPDPRRPHPDEAPPPPPRAPLALALPDAAPGVPTPAAAAPVPLPVAAPPPAVVTAPAPADAGLPLREVLRLPGFAWLAVAFSLYTLAANGVAVHLVPYLTERGIAPGGAAALTGAVGATQLLGRLLFAPLEGRLSRGALSGLVFLVQPLSLLALVLLPGTAGVAAFVALYGGGRGAATLLRVMLVAGRYGAHRYGSVSGALALCLTLAQAAGPLVIGAGRDALGAYDPLLWALVCTSVLAVFAAVRAESLVTRPPAPA